MKASVIISGYESRGGILATAYAACFQSTHSKDYEVFIVDNKCLTREEVFGISELQKTCKNLYLIKDRRLNFSALFNQAAYRAKGKYLLFLSSHCNPKHDWVEKWVKHANKSKCKAAVGRTFSIPSDNIVCQVEEEFTEEVMPKLWDLNKAAFLEFHNALIRKDCFVENDGIDEDIPYVSGITEFGARMHNKGEDIDAVAGISVGHIDAETLNVYCEGAYNEGLDKIIIYLKRGLGFGQKYFPHPTLANHFNFIKTFRLPLFMLLTLYQDMLAFLFFLVSLFKIKPLQKRIIRNSAIQAHRRGQLFGLKYSKKFRQK